MPRLWLFSAPAPAWISFGRLCGASLLPLETLGRPRIDVMMTLSGIFRDLLPLQTRMLAEACYLAAAADEPEHLNFVRKHALAYVCANDCDLETAALPSLLKRRWRLWLERPNMLMDHGRWDDEDGLGDMFAKRKCFAHGRDGHAAAHQEDHERGSVER